MSSELFDRVIRPMLVNKSLFLVVEGYVAAKHAHPVEVLVSECRRLVLEALDLCVRVSFPDKQVRLWIIHCGCKVRFADQREKFIALLEYSQLGLGVGIHLRDLAVREVAAVQQPIAIVIVKGVGTVSADLVHCLEGFVTLDNDFAVDPAAAVPTDEVWCF